MITQCGNCDIQYVCNKYGAAEYCTSYATKQEAPDEKFVLLLLHRFYSHMQIEDNQTIPLKEHYRGICSALLSPTVVGATQAIWVLLNQKLAEFSRSIITLNPLKQDDVLCSVVTDKSILDVLEEDDSPVYSGIRSQLGRRRAYATFLEQQRTLDANAASITMFVLYTNYRCENANPKRKSKLHAQQSLNYLME